MFDRVNMRRTETLYASTNTSIYSHSFPTLRQSIRFIRFALISSQFHPEEVWPWLRLVVNGSHYDLLTIFFLLRYYLLKPIKTSPIATDASQT